jgi:CAAX prenyl protease-like protein
MASAASLERTTVAAYVLPFAVFIGFLAVNPVLPVPQWARFFMEAAVIVTVSRHALAAMPTRPLFSILLGIAVFIIWIGPDQIYPAYRSLPLFSNAVIGHATATTTLPQRTNAFFLTFRILNSVIAVPILEELFWRGFLMRWLIGRDFRTIPLGTWSAEAFWIVALLFASEHGPYWDVGLITGVIYNWWMLRTRNLWNCIIAHAVTNACLAAWVIGAGQWQYWL